MSLPADELYRLAGIEPSGTTLCGEDVPCKYPGVYVISVQDAAIVGFLEHPSADKERERWKPDEEIIYIGRAINLRQRLKQFRKHIYGRKAPHAGGQAILLLDCPKVIRWAEQDDYQGAERSAHQSLPNSRWSHAFRQPHSIREGEE